MRKSAFRKSCFLDPALWFGFWLLEGKSQTKHTLSRDNGGGFCPGYEFIGDTIQRLGLRIPICCQCIRYDILLLVLCDRKLGAIYFSNTCVNSLSVFSNPPIYCFIWFYCWSTYCLIDWISPDLLTLGTWDKGRRYAISISLCSVIFCWRSIVNYAKNFSFVSS
jgi:hypothetical protein